MSNKETMDAWKNRALEAEQLLKKRDAYIQKMVDEIKDNDMVINVLVAAGLLDKEKLDEAKTLVGAF